MSSPTISQGTTADVDLSDLKRKSVRGGAVTMLSQAISIAIQLTSTVVLARLLSPNDYGVIAMVMAVTGFAGLFRDLGLSSAAIQKKDLTRSQQSNLFWLNVAMGAVLTALVAIGSPLVARFYGKPELTAVTLVLSSSFLIGSLGTQHGARLVRELLFGRKAIATIAGAMVNLTVAVALAVNGFSYWSLVWGNLCGAATTTTLLFLLSPFWPRLPSRGSGVRDMLKFGANVMAFDFVNYFSRNLDNILIGRYWGTLELGFYNRAYSLLMFPINAIRGPLGNIAFPALCKIQNDRNNYRVYYRELCKITAIGSMLITSFLFVYSKPIIYVLLGPKWDGVSPIFSVLAISSFIQVPLSHIGSVNLSLGNTSRHLRQGIFFAFLTCTSFAIGVFWGGLGVAIAYAIAVWTSAYPLIRWTFIGTCLHPRDFLQSIARPALASMITAALFDLVPVSREHCTIWIVIIAGISYTVAYFSVLFIVLREHTSITIKNPA